MKYPAISVLKSKLFFILFIGLISVSFGLTGSRYVQSLAAEDKAAPVHCPDVCVALTQDGMHPDELAVKVGDTVQFNSADGRVHNLAAGDGAHGHEQADSASDHQHIGGYLSGEFGADEAWRVRFDKSGTYLLHDHYDPNLKILIVVYEDRKAAVLGL
jgi:plastocyanin